MFYSFLDFSDSAKFADVARNIILGRDFGIDFTFFGGKIFNYLSLKLFPAGSILPVTPVSIAFFYKIFGINDFAVVATSFFYFLLTILFVFLLSKKIFKNSYTGLLSALAVGFNYDLINYAISGASESPFIFEIISSLYFISLRKKWATAIAFLLLVLMYFTRTQAFIYIWGAVLFYLLIHFDLKKALLYFSAVSVLAFLGDKYILIHSQLSYIYSVTSIGSSLGNKYLPGVAVSDALRGGVATAGLLEIIKKIFYNLYNFYKLMPQIVNSYLFALFIVGIFNWTERKIYNSFKIITIFMFAMTLFVTAAGIPLYRYLHPVVPLVYIIAVGTVVWIFEKLFNNKKTIVLTSTLLIMFFAVGPTLGIFLLDSRFERNTHNVGQPPVYVKLAWLLRDNTQKDDVVLTNLDTWGSWYGERKTVWFPLMPKQIIDPSTGKIPFSAIYLTSYLNDDENYYMGLEWKVIFNNPTDSTKWTCDGCVEIAKEFKLKAVYKISSTENYERQDSSAILLIKK